MTETTTLIGLGEMLWDEFPDGRRPGGAPANVAYHATMVGLRGSIASRVGRDQDGDILVEQVRQHGVDVSLVQTDQEHPTGRVTVDLEEGQPSYTIHPAAWDYLEPTDELIAAAADAGAIAFGTLAQRNTESQKTIAACLEAAPGLRVYDVNLRQHFYDKDTLTRSLRLAHIVKLNTEERMVIAKLLELPSGDDFAAAVRDQFDISVVCLTHGSDGCELFGDSRVRVGSEPIQVADAVGAGDSFTAALTFARLSDWPLEESARFANAVGGLVASERGAMPSVADRVRELRDSIGG